MLAMSKLIISRQYFRKTEKNCDRIDKMLSSLWSRHTGFLHRGLLIQSLFRLLSAIVR